MNNVVETEYRLETNATVTIAGNVGNVQNIGPTQYGERWVINFLGASGTANAKLQVMRGNSFSPARQLDVTNTASGDSSNTDIPLQAGETISFWWTGGVNGAVMTCSISGSRFVRGQRAY